MKVIILAAGKGTRMKKLFPDTPKALIPVRGKPIMEHIIKQFAGFEILLNVSGKEAKAFKYLKLPLLIEETPLGNAGAIKYFSKELGNSFVAIHTDTYSDLNPKDLVNAHQGYVTMTVKDLSKPKDFGVVAHEDRLITGFTRKRLINCGIYSFSKEAVQFIGDGFQDVDKDLFPKLIREKKLFLYEHKGTWEDAGRQEYWA